MPPLSAPRDPMDTILHGACIVFDLDGTLVDTAPDLVVALNKTIKPLGLAPMPLETVRSLVGRGAPALIERAMRLQGRAIEAAHLDDLTTDFVHHYRAAIADFSRPFPGCLKALDSLAAAGAILAVCTNKRQDLSEALLNALGIAVRFAAIVGADSVPRRKPDPGHFVEAVTRAGGALSRSLMVGDGSADIGAATAAGRPVLLARFGYLDGPAESLGATALFDHYDALPGLCRTHLSTWAVA